MYTFMVSFVTMSVQVRLWHFNSGQSKKWTTAATINTDDAATAIAFAPLEYDGR